MLNRKFFSLAFLLSLAILALFPSDGFTTGVLDSPKNVVKTQAQPQNVILISWDGLDRSAVRKMYTQKTLPNLMALTDEGSWHKIDVVGHRTCTKPGHAEMLTGLSAEITGVFSNSDFQPIPEGYTVFEKLQEHFGKDKIRTIMVTGKLAHVGGRGPDVVRIEMEKKAKNPKQLQKIQNREVKGEPFYLTKNHLDVFDNAQRDASETGPLCLKYLDEYKSDRLFAFLHFSDPDHSGHKYGSSSQEYLDAAAECDKGLGEIVSWLKSENLYDRTVIYVMADHGFDKNAKTHNDAPNSWLVTNDPDVGKDGIIADVPATILARFGVDVNILEPPLLGKPLFE